MSDNIEAVTARHEAVGKLAYRERQAIWAVAVLVTFVTIISLVGLRQVNNLSVALRHATDLRAAQKALVDRTNHQQDVATAQREELLLDVQGLGGSLNDLLARNGALEQAVRDLASARTPAERRAAVARLRASGGSASTSPTGSRSTGGASQPSPAQSGGPPSSPSSPPPSSTTSTTAPCRVQAGGVCF